MAHVITAVNAWEALDSRGNPTVAASIEVDSRSRGLALAPAGASAGGHEAAFLRDGSAHYGGLSVREVIATSLPLAREALLGCDADDPSGVEKALRTVDPTNTWSLLGGNVTTALTVAAWLAVAEAQARAPWRVMADWTGSTPLLPIPMVNIVSGGAHAAQAVDIQDVLVIPTSSHTVEEAIETAWRVRWGTQKVMSDLGYATALIADEGGLAAGFPRSEEAIHAVVEGIRRAGFVPGEEASLALDVAANEFHVSGPDYLFEGASVNNRELAKIIEGWTKKWPISSVEDPLAEDDDWSCLSSLLNTTHIVGDDRYATSLTRLAGGIDAHEADSVLIKPNQTGSLWGAMEAIRIAQVANWGTIVSARSGDTEEQWLVDLAVGLGAGQIKVGSTMRSERTAKWNRMLELSATENLRYAANTER